MSRNLPAVKRRLAAVLIAAATSWMWPLAAAHAAEEDSARIMRSEFERQIQELDPTPAQREALDAAYKAYTDEYDAAHTANSDLQRWLWSNSENGNGWYGGEQPQAFGARVYDEYLQVEHAWQLGWRAIETRYFDRLTLIAPGRDEVVASFKRQRLCHRLFNDAHLYGLQGTETDLLSICDEVEPSLRDEAPMRDAMHEYEIALDALLAARDSYMLIDDNRRRQQSTAIRAARERGEDLTSLLEERRKTIVKSVRLDYELRSLQQSTAVRFVQLAQDPRVKADLEEAVHLALRPFLKLEGGISLETVFAEALGLQATPEQRERILAMREEYRQKRRAACSRIDAMYLQSQKPEIHDAIWRAIDAGNREESQRLQRETHQPWEDAIAQWQTVCGEFVARLHAITAEAQASSQPDEASP